MFIQNVKSSLLVLPWLLLPLAVSVFFITMVDPWIQENGHALRSDTVININIGDTKESFDEDESFDEELEYTEDFAEEFDDLITDVLSVYRWKYSNECFNLSTAFAILSNLLFLLILPCALGGFNPGIKRAQFYLGFFIQLSALVMTPVVYFLVYGLDHTTFIILLALHALSFMGTYIIGSRFVSPAYRKAFWFA